jgi:hypothetical protein
MNIAKSTDTTCMTWNMSSMVDYTVHPVTNSIFKQKMKELKSVNEEGNKPKA